MEAEKDGFLQQPESWNEQLALTMAQAEGIGELTERHWKVIRYLREHYREFGAPPLNGKLCKETGCTLREIYELFPSGPTNGACRIAGLPKPATCAG